MEPELIEVTSSDGRTCKGVLRLPEGEGPFPGVVAMHGGMGDQTDEELMAMATSEQNPPEHLIRHGYAVLAGDYRHRSHVHMEIDDTVAAYQALCTHPKVRADRVALLGTSHGAVCSIYAAMRVTPACLVAEEGATDLAYRYEVLYRTIRERNFSVDGYMQLDRELWDELAERLGGPPHIVPHAYEAASGAANAHRIHCPVLIVSGDGDYRPNCLTMAAALLQAGRDCELALYDDARHAFWWFRAEIPAMAQADERIFAFLAKHLRGE